ncbi:NUDIX hydrolase [Mangrovimonas cancribranchiae]|uniref:NUDIX domain-containing protein n=1 Tax=Mangrovimonas cancribranchiae TaxID=3080055 RepID=A0AAU6P0M4_9FLAO
MVEEFIDIVTKDGKPTGKTALKSVIHSEGHYHNTAHLWLYTKAGKILLAQRSFKKAICPGLWDVSVAGHVDAGETIEQAILRETQEEISLTLQQEDLYKIGVFPCFQTYDNGIIDNEFHHTFIAELGVPLEKLKPQPNEVEALQLVCLDTSFSLLINSHLNNYFIASNRAYYEMVFQRILEHIN